MPKSPLLHRLLRLSPIHIRVILPSGVVCVRIRIISGLILALETNGIGTFPSSILNQLRENFRGMPLYGAYPTDCRWWCFWSFDNLRHKEGEISQLLLNIRNCTYLIDMLLPWGFSLSMAFILLCVESSVCN